MADILIRQTHPRDIGALAACLRDSDRAELAAVGFDDPLPAIHGSVQVSTLCWTAMTEGGHVICIFGVSPYEGQTGSPWMLGTPLLDRHARVLVRVTRSYIDRMIQVYPHLLNFVHADNHTSVRWLRRLGFTLAEPQPYGTRGELFHQFEMRA